MKNKYSSISIVIPCYRSEKTVSSVVDRITETMRQHEQDDYEVILIDDGSPDNTAEVLTKIALNDMHVKAILLSRNFGQHSALMAGYSQAKGEYIVGMDDDGEHDPADMFKLIDELDKGFDYVCAAFTSNDHSLYKRIGSRVNDWMATTFIGKPKNSLFSSYYVMRRFVMLEIIKTRNPHPYVGGMLVSITKKLSTVPIDHHKRIAGTSGYNLRRSIALWLNGITAYSVKPLTFSMTIAMIFTIFGFLFGLYVILRKLVSPEIPAGYSSIVALISLIGGMIMLLLNMIGEYVGRIYLLVNKIPQYVIREIVSLDEGVVSGAKIAEKDGYYEDIA